MMKLPQTSAEAIAMRSRNLRYGSVLGTGNFWVAAYPLASYQTAKVRLFGRWGGGGFLLTLEIGCEDRGCGGCVSSAEWATFYIKWDESIPFVSSAVKSIYSLVLPSCPLCFFFGSLSSIFSSPSSWRDANTVARKPPELRYGFCEGANSWAFPRPCTFPICKSRTACLAKRCVHWLHG